MREKARKKRCGLVLQREGWISVRLQEHNNGSRGAFEDSTRRRQHNRKWSADLNSAERIRSHISQHSLRAAVSFQSDRQHACLCSWFRWEKESWGQVDSEMRSRYLEDGNHSKMVRKTCNYLAICKIYKNDLKKTLIEIY